MKKKIAAGALALATAGTALLGSAGIADAVPGQGTYNVRRGPGTDYPIVGKIHNPTCKDWSPNGIAYKIFYEKDGKWMMVPKYNGYVWNPNHNPWC